MNIGTANDVITIQIQNSNIPFKYQMNLPRNTPVGLPKAFQRKTNWKYWIKYIKPIWCPQQYPCVLPLKGPTWGSHETHVCLPSVLPIFGQLVITIKGTTCGLPLMGHTGVCNNFQHGASQSVLPLKVPIWEPHKTHSVHNLRCPCVSLRPLWAALRGTLCFAPRNTHITGDQNGYSAWVQPSWSAMVRSHPESSSHCPYQ